MVPNIMHLLSLLASCLIAPALPCNIPVFRYALERWPSDDYQLVVYSDGPLADAAEQSLLAIEASVNASNGATQQVNDQSSKSCNLVVVRVDVSTTSVESTDPRVIEARKRWKTEYSNQKLDQLKTIEKPNPLAQPFAELRSASIGGKTITVWSGELSKWDNSLMLESPVRRQLCQNLMRGDAVVWLLIQSKDAERNMAVRKLLLEQNKELSQKIELPDGIGLPGSELYSEVPLLLNFTILDVDREDPQETFLKSLLSRYDAEAFSSDEPLVVPVFGRGRALEVIPASRLDAGMVGDLTAFLCGACSCQVKERNPGFDLLLTMQWQEKLFGTGPYPPPQDAGLGSRALEIKMRKIPSGKAGR